MKFIIGILMALAFYTLLANQIKKRPVMFYVFTYLWINFTIMYYALKLNLKAPSWFTMYFMDIFQRGIFSTATFVIVMFIGVFIKHTAWSRKMMSIRGEISIIGSLFVICHNVLFGVVYFPALFKHPEMMTPQTLIASILTVILLILLIPLFITSFKCVRRKMNGKSWKKLQRMAYPFFMLIYVHVMVLYSANPSAHMFDIIVYSIVFLGYAVLRIRKALVMKAKKQNLKAA